MDAQSPTTQSAGKAGVKGLYSRLKKDVKVRNHRVRYLVWRLRKVCPWISDSDLPAARAWAQLNILSDVAYARLREEGMTTDGGDPKKLLAEFRALKAAELAYSRELGLTPAARKQMAGTGKGFDLAAEFAALNARQAETALETPWTLARV
jgi:hypothetical protein